MNSEEEANVRWFQHWGTCKREKDILNDKHLCSVGTHNINSFLDKKFPQDGQNDADVQGYAYSGDERTQQELVPNAGEGPTEGAFQKVVEK